MKITKKEVEYIALLARLKIDESQIEKVSIELNNILTYMEKLREIDTKDIEPTFHSVFKDAPLRKDVVENPRLSDEKVLGNAPEKKENFFKVPKVI